MSQCSLFPQIEATVSGMYIWIAAITPAPAIRVDSNVWKDTYIFADFKVQVR